MLLYRSAFNKHGGNLGTNGSLSFLFDRKGIFTIKNEGFSLEDMELEMIDAGAEDFEVDGDTITVTCAKEDFGSVNRKLNELGIEPEEAGLKRIPNDTKKLDLESARKVLRLIDTLEDDDDIQFVYHNLEMTDELAEELGIEIFAILHMIRKLFLISSSFFGFSSVFSSGHNLLLKHRIFLRRTDANSESGQLNIISGSAIRYSDKQVYSCK